LHTHLRNETLTRDDLTDLTVLRLDAIAAVGVGRDGGPGKVHVAHLTAEADAGKPYKLLSFAGPHAVDLDFAFLLQLGVFLREYALIAANGRLMDQVFGAHEQSTADGNAHDGASYTSSAPLGLLTGGFSGRPTHSDRYGCTR
jgi:hypothetical protein